MKTLSEKHTAALQAFASPSGAPYGPQSNRPHITARVAGELARAGLVTLSTWEGLPWGEATPKGKAHLQASEAVSGLRRVLGV